MNDNHTPFSEDLMTQEALNLIVSEIVNGKIFEEDYSGFFATVDKHLFVLPLTSFPDKINDFLMILKKGTNANDLFNYYLRFTARMLNQEVILKSIERQLKTFLEIQKEEMTNTDPDNNISFAFGFEHLSKIKQFYLFLLINKDYITNNVYKVVAETNERNKKVRQYNRPKEK